MKEQIVVEYDENYSPDNEIQYSNTPEKVDVACSTCFFLNEDVGIQNVAFTLDADTQTVVSKEEAFVQATVTTEEASTEISENIQCRWDWHND